MKKQQPPIKEVGGRGIFSRTKNCRRPSEPNRRRSHEGSVNQIKNSYPGNWMAGAMRGDPGGLAPGPWDSKGYAAIPFGPRGCKGSG